MRLQMRHLMIALFAWLAIGAATAHAEVHLLMIEQPGCVYCKRWNDEIGEKYPKTTEGSLAPLRRLQLRDPIPKDLSLQAPARFTPTFVVVSDGIEIGRIEGYPGEDFFWGLLDDLLATSDAKLAVN